MSLKAGLPPKIFSISIPSLASLSADKCQICLEDDKNEPLILPCDCTNGVHNSCLETWHNYRCSLKCTICKSSFECEFIQFKPLEKWRLLPNPKNYRTKLIVLTGIMLPVMLFATLLAPILLAKFIILLVQIYNYVFSPHEELVWILLQSLVFFAQLVISILDLYIGFCYAPYFCYRYLKNLYHANTVYRFKNKLESV